jgi:chaperonin cofactor prefoldin
MANIEKLEKRLMDLKDKIERTKTEFSRAEGALQQLHERLEKEFGVKSEEEAIALLSSLQKQEDALNEKIKALVEDMEAKYGL